MSLPPEHISIKRRRQEEPVELLYLENDRHQTKRRFTDYCFQRVKADTKAPVVSKELPTNHVRESSRAVSSHAASGIPVVRATSPGAEIKEEAERRAAQKVLRDRYLPEKNCRKPTKPALDDVQKGSLAEILPQHLKPNTSLRRFHLHHGPKVSPLKHLSGIQKRKTARRNHLATFVERSKVSRRGSDLLHKIASRPLASALRDDTAKNSPDAQPVEENRNSVPRRINKTGQSMHDHPSTWDFDSDQLAEELAAFALEISQDENQGKQDSTITKAQGLGFMDAGMNLDDDFIYDTYIRVPIGDGRKSVEFTNDVGLLVIDDEDQELWQTYIESDDESEWDEEDPDSNAEDNPANEYPDEEVDSEDEYGYGSYKNRKFASDDEEYDLNDPWGNSE